MQLHVLARTSREGSIIALIEDDEKGLPFEFA